MKTRRMMQRLLSGLGLLVLLAGCGSLSPEIGLSTPGTQADSAGASAPKAEICREVSRISPAPGHVDSKGLPAFSLQELRAIAGSNLGLPVVAGQLRAELGDSARTLEQIRVYNARWDALCSSASTEKK